MTDTELEEIRQAFTVEAGELLTELETALLGLEAEPADHSLFNSLFRTVHTIKGSAGIVCFEQLEAFLHRIEHLLVQIRDGRLWLTPALIAILLECHDHIKYMVTVFCSNSPNVGSIRMDIQQHLLDRLDEWQSGPTAKEVCQQSPPRQEQNCQGDPVSAAELGGGAFGFFDEACAASPTSRTADSPPPADAAVQNGRSLGEQRAIRVDAAKLDQLSDLIVELVTASSVLEAHIRSTADAVTVESALHVSNLVKQIQEKSMVFRMVPVNTLFRRFQRVIHDIGTTCRKDIRLVIEGGDTELDKVVAEKLHEPLLHLVRNAVDHGIEPAESRRLAGKPAHGTVTLGARHENGTIIITVSDDGAGISLHAVARKAYARGLIKQEGEPYGKDILNCIFEPGFSTLDQATVLSGRGVGMDVVKETVESLRGRIDISTVEGSGTSFSISIPLSLSLVDGFMVSLAGTLYILPMECVLETLELPDISRSGVMVNGCLNLRGELLPCLDLRELLEVRSAAPERRHIIVVRHGARGIGLITDRLLGEIKTVIKPLGRVYRNHRCVSGAGILGDGSIALFLEIDRLIDQTLR